jgi:hypothetical protein
LKSRAVNKRAPANAASKPMAMPTPAIKPVWRMISDDTDAGAAPTAIRTPNSCRLREV